MATKANVITSMRLFLQESQTSGGFWAESELLDYIDYSILELWQHWCNNPTDNNPWRIQHEIAAVDANGETSLGFGGEITTTDVGSVDRIVDVYSDSNTVIPRWRVATSATGQNKLYFDSALPNEKVWVYAIHKPKHLYDVGANATGNSVDVPRGLSQWIMKRACMYALQKSGQDTQDIKAETDKMLQSLVNTRVEEGMS